jgi:uncharacterized protein (TIRG00374 family)
VTNWRVWLGLAISAASIWLVLQQVDLRQVGQHMASANPVLMLVLAASVPLTVWMKAARWRLFFRPQDKVTTPGLFSAMFIGYMVIVIVPLRVGELVRAFVVAEGARVSFSRVLATIVVEKVLDVLVVALLLLGLVQLMPLPDLLVRGAQAGGMLVIASVIGLAALALAEQHIVRAIGWIESRVPYLARLRLDELLISFNEGLDFIRHPRAVAAVAGWTVLVWAVASLTIWAGLLGTGVTTSTASVLLVMSVTNLGMVVPSGPGYVGTYHALVVEALKVFGVESSQALGTAVLLHGITFGTVLAGGLMFLWRGQFSLGKLLSGARQTSAAAHTSSVHAQTGSPSAGSAARVEVVASAGLDPER